MICPAPGILPRVFFSFQIYDACISEPDDESSGGFEFNRERSKIWIKYKKSPHANSMRAFEEIAMKKENLTSS